MAKKLTKSKAREILHDKEVHGHPLTDKQRRFFGAVASGYAKFEEGGWLDKYADGGDIPIAQNGEQTQPRILQNFEKFRTSPEGKDIFRMMEENRIAKKRSGRVEYSDIDPITDVLVPMVGIAGTVGKQTIKKGIEITTDALKNPSKYHPWGFTPNPDAYYRGIGRTGYDDAIESGLIRQKQSGGYGETYFADKFKSSIQYSKNQSYGVGDVWSDEPGAWKMMQPKDPRSYIAEIPRSAVPNATPNMVGGSSGYSSTKDPILTKNVKLLKEDWWKGYKEIPKKENGGQVYLGYDMRGRNYSPAWGGRWQNGTKLYPENPIPKISGLDQIIPSERYPVKDLPQLMDFHVRSSALVDPYIDPGTIRQAEEEPSLLSKAWNVVVNPIQAFGYSVRGEELPHHFQRGSEGGGLLDMATFPANPAAMAQYVSEIPSHVKDFAQEPSKLGALMLGMDATMAFPAMRLAKSIGKQYTKVVDAAKAGELYNMNPFANFGKEMNAYKSVTANRAKSMLEGNPAMKFAKPGKAEHYFPVLDDQGKVSHYVIKNDAQMFADFRGSNPSVTVTVPGKKGKQIDTQISMDDLISGKFSGKLKGYKIGDKSIDLISIPNSSFRVSALPYTLSTKPGGSSTYKIRDLDMKDPNVRQAIADDILKNTMKSAYGVSYTPNVEFTKGKINIVRNPITKEKNPIVLEADPQKISMVGAPTAGEKAKFIPKDIGEFEPGKTVIPRMTMHDKELGLTEGLEMLRLHPVKGYVPLDELERSALMATGQFTPTPSTLTEAIINTDQKIRDIYKTIASRYKEPISTEAEYANVQNARNEITSLWNTRTDLERQRSNMVMGYYNKVRPGLLDQIDEVGRKAAHKKWQAEQLATEIEGVSPGAIPGTMVVNSQNKLANSLNTGTAEYWDFSTGNKRPMTVNIPSTETTLSLNKNQVNKEVQSLSDIQVSPDFAEMTANNIKIAEKEIPGFVVVGSARTVAESKVPTLFHDYDGFISESNYNQYVKGRLPYVGRNGPAEVHVFNSKYGKQGEFDFNIVEQTPDGKATGERAIELFRLFHPEEFDKASKKAIQAGANDIEIPYTPDELIADLRKRPSIKSIVDMLQASKPKHLNKPEAYISYINTDDVLTAQQMYVNQLLGGKGELAFTFDSSHFADVNKNKNLLQNMSFLGDIEHVAKDPKRMQAALNDYYMNNTILSRGVDIDSDIAKLEKTLKEWDPTNPKFGGSAMGAGLNHVALGYSGGYSVYSSKQLGLNLDISDPAKYVDNLKQMVSGHYPYSASEKMGIDQILSKHGFNQFSPRNPRQLIQALANDHSMLPKAKLVLEDVADLTKRRAAITNDYGNSNFAATLKKFDDDIDKLSYTLGKYIKPDNVKSFQERWVNMSRTNTNNKADAIRVKEEFYKVRNLLEGGIAKAESRYKILEDELSKLNQQKAKIIKIASAKQREQIVKKIDAIDVKLAEQELYKRDLQKRLSKIYQMNDAIKFVTRLGAIGGGLAWAAYNTNEYGGHAREQRQIRRQRAKQKIKVPVESIKQKEIDESKEMFRLDRLRDYENGGIIRDDNGYWNPDNWGKPVEIGSNNITMRGVNQPLLGISDQGHMQLMQPGKDYKFRGKKVREFPVSKNGSQIIKLDQLTNFTNYNKPTQGGWLDKYR